LISTPRSPFFGMQVIRLASEAGIDAAPENIPHDYSIITALPCGMALVEGPVRLCLVLSNRFEILTAMVQSVVQTRRGERNDPRGDKASKPRMRRFSVSLPAEQYDELLAIARKTALIDGVASCFRTYSLNEMRDLVAGLSTPDKYQWEMSESKGSWGIFSWICVLGFLR
jgi:hypothetical protein